MRGKPISRLIAVSPCWAWRSLAFALIVFSAGCAKFDHGVVDKPLPNDQRLIGYWEAGHDRSKTELIRVTEDSPTTIAIDVKSAEDCGAVQHYIATHTVILGRDFLDIVISADPAKEISVLPIAYAIDARGQLTFAWPLSAAFEEAIRDGILPGRVITIDHFTSAQISASTTEIRDYLLAHPDVMAPSPAVEPAADGSPPGFLLGIRRPGNAHWSCPAARPESD